MATFCDVTAAAALMVGTEFNTATTTLVAECITNSEDEIRTALAPRYDITSDYFQTTTSVPPALRKICLWMSVGYSYEALARGSKDGYARADRYLKKAEKELTAIVEHKANLVDTLGALIPEGTDSLPIMSSTEDYHDTFDEGKDTSWRVDRDKLQAIKDSKQ